MPARSEVWLAMNRILPFTMLMGLVVLGVLSADDQDHHGHELGSVHFPISCSPPAQERFDHGLALLHSFWYDEAVKTFSEVTRMEPACAMGYWGVAMSLYHPIWASPTPADLKRGAAAVQMAKSARAKTQRERDYIAAMEAFYKDSDKVDHRERALSKRPKTTSHLR
jgi:hypothetical protein